MGSERIDEVFDPEIAIKRAVNYYRNRGYSDKWIEKKTKMLQRREDMLQKLQEKIQRKIQVKQL